jgi:hypothetical protein
MTHSNCNKLAMAMLAVTMVSGFAGSASAAAQRTPQSLECSKEADAKGLHGKEREKFRAACKRNAMAPHAMPGSQSTPTKSSY